MSRSPKGMMEAACIARNTLNLLILKDPGNEFFLERITKNSQEKAFLHKTLFDIYKIEKDKRNAFRHLREFGKIKKERSFVFLESVKLILNQTS